MQLPWLLTLAINMEISVAFNIAIIKTKSMSKIL